MKIGIDIHGVIDKYPEQFKRLTKKLKEEGHKIAIITGASKDMGEKVLRVYDITYDVICSIEDAHRETGTKSWTDDLGRYCIDDGVWDATKGVIAESLELDIHIDDTPRYKKYFPKSCTFLEFSGAIEEFIKLF